MDLETTHNITGIILQGCNNLHSTNSWILSYKLLFSNDQKKWEDEEGENQTNSQETEVI